MGISRLEKRSNDEVRAIAGMEPLKGVLVRRRLRWYGHVERMGEDDGVRGARDLLEEAKYGELEAKKDLGGDARA